MRGASAYQRQGGIVVINLIPLESKQDILYAKRNSMLRQWVFAFLLCSLLSAVILYVGYLYLRRSTVSYDATLQIEKQQIDQQNLESTKKEVESISANLKLVTQVLSRQILFSKLITQIGQAIPSGTIIKDLSLTQDVTGGIDLVFGATDEQTGTQILLNLSDPENNIFKTADLNSIQCSKSENTNSIDNLYPCTTTIRALFSDNSDFIFINPSKPKEAKN